MILALSGYQYSASEKRISCAPLVNAHDFRCLFTTGTAWGVFSQKSTEKSLTATLEVNKGSLELSELRLKPSFSAKSVTATVSRRSVRTRVIPELGQLRIVLSEATRLGIGAPLEVVLSPLPS